MLTPENANTANPLPAPAITVSVDENLLALLRNEPAQPVKPENRGTKHPEANQATENTQLDNSTALAHPQRAAAVSAGAEFARLGQPAFQQDSLTQHRAQNRVPSSVVALAGKSDGFQSQPLGPHILAPLTTSNRTFGGIPTTSRRIFGQNLLEQPSSEQPSANPDETTGGDRRRLQLTAPVDSAAVAASLEPAIHLPVSHLSSGFGSTWNGVERRKVPRISDSKVPGGAPSMLTGVEVDETTALRKAGPETAPVDTPVEPSSNTELALFAPQTDNSPGLVLYQSPRPNRLPLLLLFGATAATLAGLAFLFGFTPAGQSHTSAVANLASPLQLKVESKDRSFISIRWNPECIPVLNAEAGRLIVLESDHAPRVIDLQPAQLKIGHIFYETSFERVEFRMEVEDAAGVVTKESFLALLPGRGGHSAERVGGLSVVSPGAPAESSNTEKPAVKVPPVAWQISPAPSQRGAAPVLALRGLALVHSNANLK